jgi:arylsulfatase A-like enzyme
MYEGYGKSAHFYGCITEMDEQVGRLQAKLKELGVYENTVQFFASDNGPEGSPPRKGCRRAGSAGPFSGRKRDLYEGGVRVPALVMWPGVIKSGNVVNIPISTLDYLPTIGNLTGAPLPNVPLDGVDMMPIIKGELQRRDKAIPFRYGRMAALVQGNYKLIINASDSAEQDVLYDLSSDVAETNNIRSAHPEMAHEMRKSLLTFLKNAKKSHAGADYGISNYTPVDQFRSLKRNSNTAIKPRNNVKK